MDRLYFQLLQEHFNRHNQMIFVAGPRQVGKTTLVKRILALAPQHWYFNWDIPEDRLKIVSFFENSKKFLEIDHASTEKPIVAFDEIHKFKHWKNFLKGFYDIYKDEVSIIVTGSAKLNIYQKGGDSLMGRYFLYRMHPLTVSEARASFYPDQKIQKPHAVEPEQINRLLQFGGFPDPYINADTKFFNQWQKLRREQFFKEEIRDLSKVNDIAQMELLAIILSENAGQLLNYTSLSKKIQVSVNTVKNWMHILEQMYFCFRVRPWHQNVTRSLIKEPKIFLWDWSNVKNEGSKIENMLASHLLKAVQLWTDMGLGLYELFFLRDKDKHEVDFLIAKDNNPWLMVEVKKSSKESLSPNLFHFQEQIKAKYAFQVAYDMPYSDYDIRNLKNPKIVPMATFLSQLP